MRAIRAAGEVDIVAFADPSPQALAQARADVPGATVCETFDDMLALDLDGIVIATPSAQHAAQAIAALGRGAAVFCQKPLGRNAAEAAAAVTAARRADRLLCVDLSYRHTAAMRAIRDIVHTGGLGRVYGVDLTFHNAYGPDKAWFYDRQWSGGGCIMDLGVHLVDLGLWVLDFPEVSDICATVLSGGAPLHGDAVEDYAVVTLTLADGGVMRLACSWKMAAGQDAVIGAQFHGTGGPAGGGAAMRNLDGSFYDFTAEVYRGTASETLVLPPDDWGGRAAADWARRLAAGDRFDPQADRLIVLSRIIDRIYASATSDRLTMAV